MTRAEGMKNCQTYRDRTCEVVFAGLETATDFNLVRQFCIEGNTIVQRIEVMLAGIRAVLAENIGEYFLFCMIIHNVASGDVTSSEIVRLCSLLFGYCRRRGDGKVYPFNINDGRFWLRLGFITLYQLVRRVQSGQYTVSSQMFQRLACAIDEVVGGIAAEWLSSKHAAGELHCLSK